MNSRTIKIFTFIFIFFNMFYGALYLFLGKLFPNIYFPSYIVKVLLIIFCFICMINILISRRIYIYTSSKYVFFYLSILLIIFADFLFIARFGYDFKYLANVFSSNLFYLFISIVCLFGNTKTIIADKNKIYKLIYKLLVFITIIAFICAIYQQVTQQLIIFKGFNDVNNYFQTNYIGSKLRITSIFSNALVFGIFSIIVSGITLSRMLFRKFNVIDCLVFLISLYCIYITYTRNVYIYEAFSICTLLIIYIQSKFDVRFLDYIIKILPVVFLLGTVFISIYLSYFSNVLGGSDLSDMSSSMYRVNIWKYYLQVYFKEAKFLDILFGFGIIQNSNAMFSNKLISDNTFLNIYVFQGIIGLVCLLVLYFVNWSIILKKLKDKNWFEIAFICFMSAYLACGYFNDFSYGNYYQVCISILIISVNSFRKKEDSKDEN